MDSFHNTSMVFHAPVQRRQTDPRGVGLAPSSTVFPVRSLRDAFVRPSKRPFSPLPALTTILGVRKHNEREQDSFEQLSAPHPFLGTPQEYREKSSYYGTRLEVAAERYAEDTPTFRSERLMDRPREMFARQQYQPQRDYYNPLSCDRPSIFHERLSVSSSTTASSSNSPSPTVTKQVPHTVYCVIKTEEPNESPVGEKKKRKARICITEGCTKYVVDHGLCIRHGGGKRCYIEGCNCRAQNRGLCWKHGGFTICKVEGCTKRAKSRGICWSHGGGTRCKREKCAKIAVSNGLCWAHGGGKRCIYDNCRKPASERTNNYCNEHFASVEDEEAQI